MLNPLHTSKKFHPLLLITHIVNGGYPLWIECAKPEPSHLTIPPYRKSSVIIAITGAVGFSEIHPTTAPDGSYNEQQSDQAGGQDVNQNAVLQSSLGEQSCIVNDCYASWDLG